MKKIILAVILLLSVKAFSQNADTSDYFSVGFYGAQYVSPVGDLKVVNSYINSIAVELEYVKLRNLSFYAKFLHQFTRLSDDYSYDNHPRLTDPITFREVFSFGARYYLRESLVKPFLQIGLVHERITIGPFNYKYFDYEYAIEKVGRTRIYGVYSYLLNTGVGINFKIYKKFYADFQYDLNWVLKAHDYKFNGFSTVGGLKYNITF
jgi:hypothetical protein